MRLLRTVLLIILIPLSLHAAITVTYNPASVLFFEPSTAPLPTERLVAKLGTLTFDRGDAPLHDPTLVTIAMGNVFLFEGPISLGEGLPYQTDTTPFHLYAVSTDTKGTKRAKRLDGSDGNHALQTEQGNLNIDPYIVHLYLVSEQNLSRFKFGGDYTLPAEGGTLGGFQIRVGSGGSSTLAPVNGSPADTSTPILPPGSNSDDPISYGDPPDTVICTFSIINEQPFELSQAYNDKKAVVATAQISLSNVASGQTYGVTLTFTNASDTPPLSYDLTRNYDRSSHY